MKITIDTNEDRKELVRIIRLLQQLVDDQGSYSKSSHSRDIFDDSAMNIFNDVSNPMANAQPITQDKPKDHSPGLFDMFGNEPPASLDPQNDKDDDDDRAGYKNCTDRCGKSIANLFKGPKERSVFRHGLCNP